MGAPSTTATMRSSNWPPATSARTSAPPLITPRHPDVIDGRRERPCIAAEAHVRRRGRPPELEPQAIDAAAPRIAIRGKFQRLPPVVDRNRAERMAVDVQRERL